MTTTGMPTFKRIKFSGNPNIEILLRHSSGSVFHAFRVRQVNQLWFVQNAGKLESYFFIQAPDVAVQWGQGAADIQIGAA
jgi:hypothetical protein